MIAVVIALSYTLAMCYIKKASSPPSAGLRANTLLTFKDSIHAALTNTHVETSLSL